MRLRRFISTFFALVLILVPWLASRAAHAQSSGTTAATATATSTVTATPCAQTPGGQPVVSVSEQIAPERFQPNGSGNLTDLGISTRPMALNPNGVNFSDCALNLVLQFKLTACNFTGAQNLQVWASKTSACTDPVDRGVGGVAICWPVSQGSTALNQAQGGVNYNVNVRDIVGPQNDSPSPTNLQSNGMEACFAQPTFLAVPININFLPLDSSGNLVGQNYEYTISADMVGPNAPIVATPKAGETLITMNWTPNTDTDTAGYDVVISPIPGHEPASDLATGGGTAVVETICPDSGVPASVDDDAGDDGALMSVMDATVSTTDASADAGCRTMVVTNAADGGTGSTEGVCASQDPVLSNGVTLAGGGSIPVATVDDAGDDAADDSSTVFATNDSGVAPTGGAGGIWQPLSVQGDTQLQGNIINPNPTTNSTVSGETSSTFTVTGLKDGFTYHLVVAAVDNSGNVGPPSTQVCDFPGPVADFWTTYRNSGGQAGGGLCALESVGAPATTTMGFGAVLAMAAAGFRRRRRNRRGDAQ